MAQSSDSPSYFPIDVGNAWQYIWVVDPPNLPADTTFQEPFEVTASVAVNELVYFVAAHPAVVDGRVIAAIEGDDSDLRPSGRAFAYPNPFRESATIFLPRQDADRVTATVYDVLGRPVASLPASDCSIEGCLLSMGYERGPKRRVFRHCGRGPRTGRESHAGALRVSP